MKYFKILIILLLTMLIFLTSTSNATIPNRISEQFTPVKIELKHIAVNAPDIAESSELVGIKITNIHGLPRGVYVTEIFLYNDFRQEPVAIFKIAKNVLPTGLTTRVKMKESGKIYVIAKLSNGEVIGTEKYIKVTDTRGCGG